MLLVAGALTIGLSGPAQATGGGPPTEQVCGPLDSGKINVSGHNKTKTIYAPYGKLITGYCVKAGSTQQGNGPEYVTVDPPATSVTISHSSGKDISHYSVSYMTITKVTPVAPTVVQSEECDVQGTYTIPNTVGVQYKLDGENIAPGTYPGPKTGVVTAVAKPGYVLKYGGFSFELNVAPAEACPPEVTAVAPTVVQSEACEVEGSYTIPATPGVQYKLDGVNVAAGTYPGPKTGTITAVALEGHELTNPEWSFALSVPAAADCPPEATAVAPTVSQSQACEVEGSYTIPATPGVQYKLDGADIAAGTYAGPKTGTITAVATGETVLTNPAFTFALNVAAAELCEEIAPTETVDVCENIEGAQTAVPAGFTLDGDQCVEIAGVETESPAPVPADKDEDIKGVEAAVPTAVNAGLGAEIQAASSWSGMVGQGLLGGGLLMLLMAGWLKFARFDRGAHQV